GMLSETALIRARALLEKGDAAGALAASRDAAAADPENAEVKKLIDEAEFLAFRQKVDAEVGGPDLAQAIRRFLERELRPEQRDWAEKALARATTQAKPPTSQLTQYFPVKLGRSLVYR